MSDLDIRWQQRFANFKRALEQLELFFEPPTLNEREQQGLVKAFEYTYELAWNSMRDLNLTSPIYNRSTAEAISSNIASHYLPSFQKLRSTLDTLEEP